MFWGSVTRACLDPSRNFKVGGEGWIRTTEGISQQIYSLPRLATSVPLPRMNAGVPAVALKVFGAKAGAGDGNRNHSRLASMRVCAGLCARQAHRNAPEPLPTATNCYNATAMASAKKGAWKTAKENEIETG